MRLIRLYIDTVLNEDGELTLPAGPARHAARVLRLVCGDSITLFNGDGFDYVGELIQVGNGAVRVHLRSRSAPNNESPIRITLAQGLARGDKMDWVVQKATELGVDRIVPVISERSEVRLDGNRARKRTRHWQAVAAAACEQCGRARVPNITTPAHLTTWLQGLDTGPEERWALLPGANRRIGQRRVPADTRVILATGPEGGFGERDTRLLDAADFEPTSLGPRILRTETAGLAALSAIQAIHGDL